MAMSGRRARSRSTSATASAREWRRFIRLRIRSWPCCSERWRCGMTRCSPASSSNSCGVDLDPVERGQAQAAQRGEGVEDRRAPARRARACRAGRGPSWSRRPRSAPLRRAPCVEMALDLAQHFGDAAASGSAPRPCGITQKVQAWSQPFCTATNARVCCDGTGARTRRARSRRAGRACAALATSPSTSGIAASCVALDLGGAAGHQQARVGPGAARPADRLAGLAHRFGGHRAAVDHHQVARRRPAARGWSRFRRG